MRGDIYKLFKLSACILFGISKILSENKQGIIKSKSLGFLSWFSVICNGNYEGVSQERTKVGKFNIYVGCVWRPITNINNK